MTSQKNRFVGSASADFEFGAGKNHQPALNQFLGEVDRDAVRASVAETSGAIVPLSFIGVQALSFL